MNTDEHRRGRTGRAGLRWLFAAALFLAVSLGAACGHPEACPEPCPRGMYCNYGACVPAHDAGDDGGEAGD